MKLIIEEAIQSTVILKTTIIILYLCDGFANLFDSEQVDYIGNFELILEIQDLESNYLSLRINRNMRGDKINRNTFVESVTYTAFETKLQTTL